MNYAEHDVQEKRKVEIYVPTWDEAMRKEEVNVLPCTTWAAGLSCLV